MEYQNKFDMLSDINAELIVYENGIAVSNKESER